MGLIGLLLVVVVLTASLWLPGIGRWLARPATTTPADAIVVLSGGGPERMMHGIALYNQGLAPQLWYTGDAPIPAMTNFTDGQFARRLAIEQGVAPEAIHLLETTSTWEDGQEIAAQVSQTHARRILVVTNWYHSRRALCVVRHHLAGLAVEVDYAAPPAQTYGPANWWQQEEGLVDVLSELIKFGFYWWRYGLAPWRC